MYVKTQIHLSQGFSSEAASFLPGRIQSKSTMKFHDKHFGLEAKPPNHKFLQMKNQGRQCKESLSGKGALITAKFLQHHWLALLALCMTQRVLKFEQVLLFQTDVVELILSYPYHKIQLLI